jgi:serine/threonine protein kinase
MGEVYRARDTRLERSVAIKVLSANSAGDPGLRQRLEREAKAVSALNHPHICTLHDIGSQDGTDYLVMELLEGETLADRVLRGPLPLDQVVKIGSEIADGLDAAHRAGIVHRDLKPGNIMLAKSGAKLLDFGLAKPAATGMASGTGPAPLLTGALTMTSPNPHGSPLTAAGSIVGTIQYMSPEQIEGRDADARSDIFALGAILYEMATGKRAFQGKSQLSVASAILEKDPEPLSSAQPTAPAALCDVISTCLAKDPEDRYASAHDVKLQLRRALRVSAPAAQDRDPQPRKWLVWAAAGLAIAVIATLAVFVVVNSHQRERAVLSTQILPPTGMAFSLTGDQGASAAISPDGRFIVAGAGGHLWLRQVDSGAYTPLPGTNDASFPFWSPDSRSIGFFSQAKLKTIAIYGGAPVVICEAQNARGGSWGKDNLIVFAAAIQAPLSKVAASGGTPVPVTTLDMKQHTTHRWPFFLPDGKHFIYLAANHKERGADSDGIYLGSIDGGEGQRLMHSTGSAIYSSGYLLFTQNSDLLAQRFDAGGMKLIGEPIRMPQKLFYDTGIWRNLFSASETGLLLYASGSADLAGRVRWLNDTGQSLTTLADEGLANPRLSPDGRRIAMERGDPTSDIWIYDMTGPVRTQVTRTGRNFSPVWSPDGQKILYTGIGGTTPTGAQATLMVVPLNDTEGTKAVNPAPFYQSPTDWSRDGKYILYEKGSPGSSELWALEMRPGAAEFPLIKTATSARDGRFSPDGKWVAYTSNESGQDEVYLAPFPGPGPKMQLSTSGGTSARWRGDGRELYFYGGSNEMVAVTITMAKGEVQVGSPRKLFPITLGSNSFFSPAYDVTADGKKFIVYSIGDSNTGQTPLSLLVNWDVLAKP